MYHIWCVSPFAANMAVKQNATDLAVRYSLAADAVNKSVYVDDCLSGADTISGAIEMQTQLQNLFEGGGLIVRKWNSSEKAVLDHVSSDFTDDQSVQLLTDPQQYTKTRESSGILAMTASDYKYASGIPARRQCWTTSHQTSLMTNRFNY